MENPVVSVIIPTSDRIKLLEKAVSSVRIQSFRNWELLIIDNGNDVMTRNTIERISEEDGRIRYFHTPKSSDGGIYEYLNYGLKHSRGRYIARLDDDDTWCNPNKLNEQVAFLEENPDYVLVGGGIVMVDENGNEMHRYCKKETDEKIRKYALLSCPFDHPAVVFRKDASDAVGGYSQYSIAEDWDFFLKLGTIGKFHNLQNYYVNYLQAGQGMTFRNETKIAIIDLKIIRKFRKDYPNYYIGVILTTMQLLFTLLPGFIRRSLHYTVRYIKRKYF